MRPLSGLALITLASIWGSNFLLVELALSGSNPAQIVAVRLWLGGLILLVCCGCVRQRLPRGWAVWARLLGMGVLGQALPWMLFAWGQENVSVSMAGVYNGVTPLASLPVVWLLLRQKGTRGEALASIVGFGGVVLLMAPWSNASSSTLTGQLACLAGAVCYAVAYAYAKHLITNLGYSKLALAAGQAIVAGVLMLILTGPQLLHPMDVNAPVLLSLIALGVGTAVAFLLNYWLIAAVGPLQAGLAFYLVPVVAMVLGTGLRGDELRPHQLAGACVVLAALLMQYVVDRREFHRAQGTHTADRNPAEHALEPS